MDLSRPMQAIANIWRNARSSARDFVADRCALAATEFAVIVPLMLVMFFGTVEFSSAVAVNRKVTMIARTLSDLTSQSTAGDDPAHAGHVHGKHIDDHAVRRYARERHGSSDPYRLKQRRQDLMEQVRHHCERCDAGQLTAPPPGSGSQHHSHLDDFVDAPDSRRPTSSSVRRVTSTQPPVKYRPEVPA